MASDCFYQIGVYGLSNQVTQSMLYAHFKVFGPIRNVVLMNNAEEVSTRKKRFGYVNYYNFEVSEVAAREMNGTLICNEKIKTRGAKKVIFSNDFISESTPTCINKNQEKSKAQFRGYTDCYYFSMYGNCIPKIGQLCQYRHSRAACQSKLLCEEWKSKNCFNRNCSFLHPGVKPQSISNGRSPTRKDEGEDKIQKSSVSKHTKCYDNANVQSLDNLKNFKCTPTPEILITNLPTGPNYTIDQIKCQLNSLLKHSGGKIISISLSPKNSKDNVAVIRFESIEEAKRSVQKLDKEHIFNCKLKASFYHSSKIVVDEIENYRFEQCGCACNTVTVCNTATTIQNKTLSANNLKSTDSNCVNCCGKPPSKPYVKDDEKSFNRYMNLLNSNDEEKVDIRTVAQLNSSQFNGLQSNGSQSNGSQFNGSQSNGNQSNGSQFNGSQSNGRQSNGRQSNGRQSNGSPPNVANNNILQSSGSPPNVANNNILQSSGSPPNIANNNILQSSGRPSNVANNNILQSSILSLTRKYVNYENGVDLLITNLDESKSAKELKNDLGSVVRALCKVNHVNIVVDGGKNIHAIVNVSTLQDAHLCIQRLHYQTFFDSKISVSLSTPRSHDQLVQLKCDVAGILLDVKTGWLPLLDFITTYKQRYQRTYNLTDFQQIKDILYVDGLPGRQFVCLLQFPVDLLKVANSREVGDEVLHVLSTHNRRIPLASLFGLYWSYTKRYLQVDNTNGEHILNILSHQSVCIVRTSLAQHVYWKNDRPQKGDILSISDFQEDVVQLLKTSANLTIPLNKFIPLYHQYFARQCRVMDYGCKDLNALLKNLNGTVEVTEHGDIKVLSLDCDYKRHMLHNSMKQLLLSCADTRLKLDNVLTSYYTFFGYTLNIEGFGYMSLSSLLTDLDTSVFKVMDIEGESFLILLRSLPLKDKDSMTLQKFAHQVVVLIEHQEDKQLGLHNLSSEYFKYYGHQLRLSELGFSKLNELVAAISSYVEIRRSRDQRTLYISNGCYQINPDEVWYDIRKMLHTLPQRAIVVLQLANLYEDILKKPFPLDTVKLDHLIHNTPSNIVIAGKGANKIIIDISPERYPTELISEQLIELLSVCTHFNCDVETLVNMLTDKKIYLKASYLRHHIMNESQFQMSRDQLIQMMPPTCRRLFEHEALLLLSRQPDNRLCLTQFPKIYFDYFSKSLVVSDYGVNKLLVLFQKLSNKFIQLEYCGKQIYITYGHLGAVYINSKNVVEENQGALLLCNFVPEYQRKFNAPFKALDYGFQKIGDLIEYFSFLFRVYGEKNMKVIVLRQRYLNNTDEIRRPDADTGEISHDLEKTRQKKNQGDIKRDVSKKSIKEKLNWWNDIQLPVLTAPPTSNTTKQLISFDKFVSDEVIQNGGINNEPKTLDNNSKVNIPSLKSFKDVETSCCSSEVIQQDGGLMRMLVGRCSPIYNNNNVMLSSLESSSCIFSHTTYSFDSPARQRKCESKDNDDDNSRQMMKGKKLPRMAANLFKHWNI